MPTDQKIISHIDNGSAIQTNKEHQRGVAQRTERFSAEFGLADCGRLMGLLHDKGKERDHGVGSTDHFSALKIWMFENKFVSLPSHLKTIEPMEVHRGQELCVIQKLQK